MIGSNDWSLDTVQRLFESKLSLLLNEANFDQELVTDALIQSIPDSATLILNSLKKRSFKMLKEHEKLHHGFQKRCYKRWKSGFDLFRMLLVISYEAGDAYNTICRPQAIENKDYRFEAIANLHARGLRVSQEIYSLLRCGFPDGALSRWRTLHEIVTTALFLGQQEVEISKRFIFHRIIMSEKAMNQYIEFQDRAGLSPVSDEKYSQITTLAKEITDLYGNEIKKDYGWARPLFKDKKITFRTIEKHVKLDHWRPRYKWASNDIHSSYHPLGSSLSTSESSENVLLTGPSNSGFTDPAQMTAVSLSLLNSVFLLLEPNLDRLIIVKVMDSLSAEISQNFYDIQIQSTPPTPLIVSLFKKLWKRIFVDR